MYVATHKPYLSEASEDEGISIQLQQKLKFSNDNKCVRGLPAIHLSSLAFVQVERQ